MLHECSDARTEHTCNLHESTLSHALPVCSRAEPCLATTAERRELYIGSIGVQWGACRQQRRAQGTKSINGSEESGNRKGRWVGAGEGRRG